MWALTFLLIGLAAAQSGSSSNQIYRPLNEAVPACKAFSISWQPSGTNTVSLTLLRGPLGSSVAVDTLAVRIPNSGIYSWTPDSTLEAGSSLYLIQLTDDITGEDQTSAQFGISKGPDCRHHQRDSTCQGLACPRLRIRIEELQLRRLLSHSRDPNGACQRRADGNHVCTARPVLRLVMLQSRSKNIIVPVNVCYTYTAAPNSVVLGLCRLQHMYSAVVDVDLLCFRLA